MVADVSQPKVLVIDDEYLFREMLQTVLSEEYNVLAAESADVGLRLLEADHPDAVLLDLVMPGKDGVQGLKAIRAIDPDVAVIIITGYARLETAEQVMALGANAYVEKPVPPDLLMRTIRTGVEQTRHRKREARVIDEMRDMVLKLSREQARDRQHATQADAAIELVYDLKNPLAIAEAQLDKLQKALDPLFIQDESQSKVSRQSVAQIGNMLKRCQDLTAMCRDLTRKEDCPLEEISIPELVTTVIDEIVPSAAAAGVKLDFRIYAGDGNIRGQRAPLHRAIRNLFSNAVDTTSLCGGVVRISCGVEAGGVQIRIEDHGSGYSEERLAEMLGSRYGKLSMRKGSGMGIALSRKVIEDHGGRMKVQTAEGKGSVIFVSFPVAS